MPADSAKVQIVSGKIRLKIHYFFQAARKPFLRQGAAARGRGIFSNPVFFGQRHLRLTRAAGNSQKLFSVNQTFFFRNSFRQ